jgi:hypothetical protein
MTAVAYQHGGFPPKQLDWLRLLPLIGPASAASARYDGVPDTAVLLSPLAGREAAE